MAPVTRFPAIRYLPDPHCDDSDAFSVEIQTERLFLFSIRGDQEDSRRCHALLCSQEAMQKSFFGKALSSESVDNLISEVWAKRWASGNPYSAFLVFLQGKEAPPFGRVQGDCIGHVVLDPADSGGQVDLSFVGNKRFWTEGYATEAVSALVHDYAPQTVQWGCLLNHEPLHTIRAAVSMQNQDALHLLEEIGMTWVKTEPYQDTYLMRYQLKIGGNDD